MKTRLFLLALLAVMITPSAFGVEVEIGALWYDLVARAKEAKVIYHENSVKYTGDIVIPEKVEYEGVEYNVTGIGDMAFLYRTGLTSITIPNSVKSIGNGAFDRCSGLTSLTIPSSVTSIGHSAFYGCSGLTSVTIPNSITSIEESTFAYCSGLLAVTIPNSLTIIGKRAFEGCSGLTSVTIPKSVTDIGDYAFLGCSNLSSATIGSGIKFIFTNAFAACGNLADVYCLAKSVHFTSSDAFEDSYPHLSTLHVPASSINIYKTTEPWSGFGKIVAINGGEPEQCAKPTIHYANGKLSFKCETEDVEFVSEIKDADIRKNYTAEVDLTATYHISVYATREDYQDSEIAFATLCWIEVEPQTEGITGDEVAVSEVKAMPVLIQSTGNTLTICGAPAGTLITIYDLSGRLITTAKANETETRVELIEASSLPSGRAGSGADVVIVKVGEKTVKVAR